MVLNLYIFLQFLFVFPHGCGQDVSQKKADEIIGYYLAYEPKTGDKLQMEIYKTPKGKYEIKIVWVEKLEMRDNIGSVQFRNLTYDPKNHEWINGKVTYDGSKYSTKISFSEPGKLKVRGYLGISLLGKTVYWIKEKELRQLP